MHSLRFKILAGVAVIVLLTQAGTIGTVLVTANEEVSVRTEKELTTGAELFERLMNVRATRLKNFLRAASADPGLVAAIESQDTMLISKLLAIHGKRVGADRALVLDHAGQVVATTNTIARDLPGMLELIDYTEADGMARSVVSSGDQSWEMLTVPIKSPEHLLWLSMGFLISDELAQSMATYTGLNIALALREGNSVRVLGSSLHVADEALAKGLADLNRPARSSKSESMSIGDIRSLALEIPYLYASSGVSVVLHKSMFAAMAPYRAHRNVMISLGLFMLGIAFCGALVLSTKVTQRLRKLINAAQTISVGDYGAPINISGKGELAELAKAFNAMQQILAEREEHITYQAQFDVLTGLPNRILGMQRLTEIIDNAQNTQEPVSILIIDLDSFDDIGSSLGHEFGDALLCQAAERLRAGLESEHTLARLEADNFLVVMKDTNIEAAELAANELLRSIEGGLGVRNVNISLDASIGISAFPDHGKIPDQLVLRATVAKNDAKQAQDGIHRYEEGQETCHLRQLTILGDLRRAVNGDELKLFLQPKIHLGIGVVCGAEALVRWDHPVLGFLPPGEFIPIAEKSGNISLITHWALAASIRECRLWQEEGINLPVSVNLSGRDLLDRNLPCLILELLRDHDLDPHKLILEITEEALVSDLSHAKLVLECLREIGIKVSIDDFGTGYSSLAQIKNLPADEVKIDRSFIMDLPGNRADVAIVRASVELGHSLGLEVLAEGVETQEALDWLTAQGCERAQGYLIARPMPAESFPAWVKQYKASQIEAADTNGVTFLHPAIKPAS